MTQTIITCIIIACTVAYSAYKIYKFFTQKEDKCSGCKGLKERGVGRDGNL